MKVHCRNVLFLVTATAAVLPTSCFQVSVSPSVFNIRTIPKTKTTTSIFVQEGSHDNKSDEQSSSSSSVERRKFLDTTATTATTISLSSFASFLPNANAEEETPSSSSPSSSSNNLPICVIGANGKTGSECIKACLSRSLPVIATTRSGTYAADYSTTLPSNNDASTLLSVAPCDVADPSTIPPAIRGSRAVIFAASASKRGGTAHVVDNVGLVSVAKACIENGVPHLIIVSSGGVSKPDSPVYKFLNIFGKIMEEKIEGEDSVRALYRGYDKLDRTYTVIRPGGLTVEEGLGASALELNQGDTKSGRIARADVASLCVEAVRYPELTGRTTFECYDADTAKPLATVGMSNLMKQRNGGDDGEVFVSGRERRGSTFEEIFSGLEMD